MQYYKDYTIDKLRILIPQAIKPEQVEHMPNDDRVYDRPAKKMKINLD